MTIGDISRRSEPRRSTRTAHCDIASTFSKALALLLAVVGTGATSWSAPDSIPKSEATRPTEAQRNLESASIVGYTFTTDGAPIPGAAVTLSGPSVIGEREAVSDNAGRFAFSRLPSGQFSVRASKPGFVASMFGGEPPATEFGTVIDLEATQSFTATLELRRAATVEGSVLTEAQRPVPRAKVRALRCRIEGRDVMTSTAIPTTATVQTGDDGHYRISELREGQYLIVVLPPNDSGLGLSPSASVLNQAGPTRLPDPVYYPGVTDLSDAQILTLSQAEARSGIDFVAHLSAATKVHVAALGNLGVRIDELIAHKIGTPAGLRDLIAPSKAREQADGSLFMSLGPGSYALVARWGSGAATSARLGPSTEAVPRVEWSSASIDISGQETLEVPIGPLDGQYIGGIARWDRPASSGRGAPEKWEIGLQPTGARSAIASFLPRASVSADGSFVIGRVPPGRYRWHLSNTNAMSVPAWYVESSSAAADGLVQELEVQSGADLSRIALTFSDRRGDIAGTVANTSGGPCRCLVVAFPDNALLRVLDSPLIPRPVRPSTSGSFLIRGVPIGSYVVGTVVGIDPDNWFSPELLEQIATRSPHGITVTAGGAARVSLVAR